MAVAANGRPEIDAKAGLASCITALGGLYIGTQFGGIESAAGYWLAGLAIVALPFSALILSRAARAHQSPVTKEAFV